MGRLEETAARLAERNAQLAEDRRSGRSSIGSGRTSIGSSDGRRPSGTYSRTSIASSRASSRASGRSSIGSSSSIRTDEGELDSDNLDDARQHNRPSFHTGNQSASSFSQGGSRGGTKTSGRTNGKSGGKAKSGCSAGVVVGFIVFAIVVLVGSYFAYEKLWKKAEQSGENGEKNNNGGEMKSSGGVNEVPKSQEVDKKFFKGTMKKVGFAETPEDSEESSGTDSDIVTVSDHKGKLRVVGAEEHAAIAAFDYIKSKGTLDDKVKAMLESLKTQATKEGSENPVLNARRKAYHDLLHLRQYLEDGTMDLASVSEWLTYNEKEEKKTKRANEEDSSSVPKWLSEVRNA